MFTLRVTFCGLEDHQGKVLDPQGRRHVSSSFGGSLQGLEDVQGGAQTPLSDVSVIRRDGMAVTHPKWP